MKRNTKTVVLLLLLTVYCLLPTVLLAADTVAASASPVGDAIKDVINNTLIPLVVALVGSLISILLVKIKKRLNIQISAETEFWIRKQAENAVQLVAEKAAAKVKLDGVTITSNEKLNMALAALITKVPDLSKEQADAYIHAALARISGEGATKDQTVT
jgi:hypothetical protein